MPLVLCLIGRIKSSLEFCGDRELECLELEKALVVPKVQSIRPRKLRVSLVGLKCRRSVQNRVIEKRCRPGQSCSTPVMFVRLP